MLFSKIPNVGNELEELRTIAPSGFVVALNLRWIGPEYLHSEYPEKWKAIYEEKSYYMFDPIFYWTVMNTGATRWSEVGYPDPHKIGRKAAEYGLVYGATICKKEGGMRSFLSASRADRELLDHEIARMEEIILKWVDIVAERPSLSDAELEMLKCLRAGLDQNEIAIKLGVSLSTVKKRLGRVRRAFNASTITEALAVATEKRYF